MAKIPSFTLILLHNLAFILIFFYLFFMFVGWSSWKGPLLWLHSNYFEVYLRQFFHMYELFITCLFFCTENKTFQLFWNTNFLKEMARRWEILSCDSCSHPYHWRVPKIKSIIVMPDKSFNKKLHQEAKRNWKKTLQYLRYLDGIQLKFSSTKLSILTYN